MSARLTWTKYGGERGRKGACYELSLDGVEVGVQVQHCGHPTANWPYYVTAHWLDEIVIGENGRGFRLLKLAKDRAEELFLEREVASKTFEILHRRPDGSVDLGAELERLARLLEGGGLEPETLQAACDVLAAEPSIAYGGGSVRELVLSARVRLFE